MENKLGKTFVIYHSRGGSTRFIAQKIAETLSGDTFEIKVKNPSSLIRLYIDSGKAKLLGDRKTLELENDAPDLSSYETIFVGAPIYAGTITNALFSFLQKVDFQSKTIIPFATFNGGGAFSYFEDFKNFAKNANTKNPRAFSKVRSEKTAKELKIWLESL